MAKSTPGESAQELVQAAEETFNKGGTEEARAKLAEAFALREEVERYSGSLWQQNHHAFTEAMLDMAVLWYKLGDIKQGDSLASRAQAWADDPNCSSQKNFERSFSVRSDKEKYLEAGRAVIGAATASRSHIENWADSDESG